MAARRSEIAAAQGAYRLTYSRSLEMDWIYASKMAVATGLGLLRDEYIRRTFLRVSVVCGIGSGCREHALYVYLQRS